VGVATISLRAEAIVREARRKARWQLGAAVGNARTTKSMCKGACDKEAGQ